MKINYYNLKILNKKLKDLYKIIFFLNRIFLKYFLKLYLNLNL